MEDRQGDPAPLPCSRPPYAPPPAAFAPPGPAGVHRRLRGRTDPGGRRWKRRPGPSRSPARSFTARRKERDGDPPPRSGPHTPGHP